MDLSCILLRRSSKLSYFFNLSPDGADTMKNIYNLYKGTDKTRVNYYEYFHNKLGLTAQQPVILLYDNETEKNKPIKQLIGICKCDEKSLREKLYLPLVDNLYVQVVPLAPGKSSCEIEDLFPQDVLDLEINGRKFGRKGTEDKSKFYNKDIFSKYIVSHYEELDFSAFVPLLDTWEKIMADYSGQKKGSPVTPVNPSKPENLLSSITYY